MQQANIIGEWRAPINTASHQKGGIHDDDTATELGFEGGTVAGSIHMEQFLPLLLATYGNDWWQKGSLSLYFKQATVNKQKVRCFISEANADSRCAVWMENEAGDEVLSGTSYLGGQDEKSELSGRLERIRPPTELKILKEFSKGMSSGIVAAKVSNQSVKKQLAVITETHPSFTELKPVLPCTEIVRIFDAAELKLADHAVQPYVGLYGGIEIQFVNGPVRADTDYESECIVMGLSDSPQTEILWRQSTLIKDGHEIARMIKMDRLMKSSSPLWS